MMQVEKPMGDEVPPDFPQATQDPVSNYLRWQKCIIAGQHVANMCFDARGNSVLGSNQELQARAVSLVCGDNFSTKERLWIARYGSSQLG